jgi:hypothetical protein
VCKYQKSDISWLKTDVMRKLFIDHNKQSVFRTLNKSYLLFYFIYLCFRMTQATTASKKSDLDSGTKFKSLLNNICQWLVYYSFQLAFNKVRAINRKTFSGSLADKQTLNMKIMRVRICARRQWRTAPTHKSLETNRLMINLANYHRLSSHFSSFRWK